jgi:hypothetical protein
MRTAFSENICAPPTLKIDGALYRPAAREACGTSREADDLLVAPPMRLLYTEKLTQIKVRSCSDFPLAAPL